MKDKFPGYFESDDRRQQLWSNAIIAIDTCVLLDCLLTPKIALDDFIKVLESFKDQLWLPYHVAQEFSQNYSEKIDELKNKPDLLLREIDSFEKDISLSAKRSATKFQQKPFDSPFNKFFTETVNGIWWEDLDTLIKEKLKPLRDCIEQFREEEASEAEGKRRLEQLLTLFSDRIGEPFSQSEIMGLIAEGEIRYRENIPPGYKDVTKPENKYGDLIIWKQLIREAKNKGKGIIFVTAEKKEDWFSKKNNGKIIGPRPELIQEMYVETGQYCHIYRTETFLNYAKSQGANISSESIEQIKAISEENQQPIPCLLRVTSWQLSGASSGISGITTTAVLQIQTINEQGKNVNFRINGSPYFSPEQGRVTFQVSAGDYRSGSNLSISGGSFDLLVVRNDEHREASGNIDFYHTPVSIPVSQQQTEIPPGRVNSLSAVMQINRSSPQGKIPEMYLDIRLAGNGSIYPINPMRGRYFGIDASGNEGEIRLQNIASRGEQ